MEDAPPPYTTTPPQPPPYSAKAEGEMVQPVVVPVPQQNVVQGSPRAEHVMIATPVYPQPAPTQVVVVQPQNSCPVCKSGYVREEFTLLGMCMAIIFFPLGIICCLLTRVRRCSYCRAIVI